MAASWSSSRRILYRSVSTHALFCSIMGRIRIVRLSAILIVSIIFSFIIHVFGAGLSQMMTSCTLVSFSMAISFLATQEVLLAIQEATMLHCTSIRLCHLAH